MGLASLACLPAPAAGGVGAAGAVGEEGVERAAVAPACAAADLSAGFFGRPACGPLAAAVCGLGDPPLITGRVVGL